MSELVRELFLEFINVTGLSEVVSPDFSLDGICVIILGIVGCVLGFRTYRMFFSAILFMTTAVAAFHFMAGTESLRSVATCVAVGGVVLAICGYYWNRIGGFVICFLIGMGVGWLLYPSYILAVACGILAGTAEVFFPVIAISVMTSLWGACMLAEGFQMSGALQVVAVLGMAVISSAWQLVLNRKQKLFAKVCPDRVRYWMEQRRK